MRGHRITAGTIAAVASVASLAGAGSASAKGDAVATIQAPARCDAAPGAQVTIRFRVTTARADGTRVPFGASGVFVLLRRSGQASLKRAARSVGAGTGRYTVRTRMPHGGLRRIDVGIDGTTSAPGGAPRPAPVLFRVVGDPCRVAG